MQWLELFKQQREKSLKYKQNVVNYYLKIIRIFGSLHNVILYKHYCWSWSQFLQFVEKNFHVVASIHHINTHQNSLTQTRREVLNIFNKLFNKNPNTCMILQKQRSGNNLKNTQLPHTINFNFVWHWKDWQNVAFSLWRLVDTEEYWNNM